jgi:hypothetical protein
VTTHASQNHADLLKSKEPLSSFFQGLPVTTGDYVYPHLLDKLGPVLDSDSDILTLELLIQFTNLVPPHFGELLTSSCSAPDFIILHAVLKCASICSTCLV